MLIWNESYSTGHEAIDRQHLRLFHFVNNLASEVASNPGAPMKPEDLEFLQTYVQVHFASEELCMFRNVCASATQNKLAHQAFLRRVEDLTSGQETTSSAELLTSWRNGSSATSSGLTVGCRNVQTIQVPPSPNSPVGSEAIPPSIDTARIPSGTVPRAALLRIPRAQSRT